MILNRILNWINFERNSNIELNQFRYRTGLGWSHEKVGFWLEMRVCAIACNNLKKGKTRSCKEGWGHKSLSAADLSWLWWLRLSSFSFPWSPSSSYHHNPPPPHPHHDEGEIVLKLLGRWTGLARRQGRSWGEQRRDLNIRTTEGNFPHFSDWEKKIDKYWRRNKTFKDRFQTRKNQLLQYCGVGWIKMVLSLSLLSLSSLLLSSLLLSLLSLVFVLLIVFVVFLVFVVSVVF